MRLGIRKIHVIAVALAVIAISAGVFYVFFTPKNIDANPNDFDLLSEKVAWMDADQFQAEQKQLTISYAPLKMQLVNYFDSHNLSTRYSLYFEDLTTGAWVGINEKDSYLPANLLKVPTMVAILKKVELGDLSLDQVVTLTPAMIDSRSGSLYNNGAGDNVTIRQLITYLIKQSDNTALHALDSMLTGDEYNNAVLSLGYPAWEPGILTMLSPKQYANGLRSLYFSTYLHRSFSQLALSIMASTDYNTQLTALLPEDVKVAHKYGEYTDGGYFHDCGIVYLPNKHYIICIMSKGSTLDEANTAISQLSLMVFNYVNK